MGDLNMQLAREFFELHRFQVLTHWPHDTTRTRGMDPAALLFVEQPNFSAGEAAEFLLRGGEVAKLQRAVVEVRAWHADRFYPSVIESNPILAHVASPEVRELAADFFRTDEHKTLLIISELPASHEPRDRTLQLLRQTGIDHIMEFPALLQDMLLRISQNANYAPSPTLQTMRLLKRYGFIRRQQMEFSFPIESGTLEDPTEKE